MKSKNKVLLIVLMLIASIFCSSCIIVHDWDDDYDIYNVYYYSDVNNAWSSSIVNCVSANGGFYYDTASDSEFIQNTKNKTCSSWSKSKIQDFLSQKGLSSYDARKVTNFFVSKNYNHVVVYIQSDSYTITALVR